MGAVDEDADHESSRDYMHRTGCSRAQGTVLDLGAVDEDGDHKSCRGNLVSVTKFLFARVLFFGGFAPQANLFDDLSSVSWCFVFRV